MNNFYLNYATGLGIPTTIPSFGLVLILLMLWSLFWKGLALWHAGRRGQPWWFLIMLVVNSAGILEIIYLLLICKLKPSELFSKKP